MVKAGAVHPRRIAQLSRGLIRLALSSLLLTAALTLSSAAGQNVENGLPPALYLKIQLNSPLKISALKPGDILEGKLSQDVYAADRKLLAAGSPVHLTVDSLGRRRKPPNDRWPWIIRIFSPRHENYPVFKSATIQLPDGEEIQLRVSVVALEDKFALQVAKKKKTTKSLASLGSLGTAPSEMPRPGKAKESGSPNVLEALAWDDGGKLQATSKAIPASPYRPQAMTIAPGMEAQLLLLNALSAGTSRPGDSFQARLVYPILSGSTILLPAGSVFEGKVLSAKRPRWLSRPGSLYLAFTQLDLPGGAVPITASLAQLEVDRKSRTRMDSEGKLTGGRPGKVWMLANLGATAGFSKLADDTSQLIVEAIVSSATDASTAGMARIISAAVGGVFLVTRHGRDIVVPKFTEINIMFDRPLLLPEPPRAATMPNKSE